MEFFHWVLQTLRDPSALVGWGGYPVLATIVFAETGILAFFLPGDSLLVAAGLYAGDGKMSLLALNAILIPAAILGPIVSYWIGNKLGPRLFNRPKSRFFNPEHIRAAHTFYERHGGKAIVIARFMPLFRTFVPVAAGIAEMPYKRYALYNVVGGALWILSMTLTGYFLGQFAVVRNHLEKVIILIVLISVTPAAIAFIRSKLARRAQQV